MNLFTKRVCSKYRTRNIETKHDITTLLAVLISETVAGRAVKITPHTNVDTQRIVGWLNIFDI